MQTNNGRGAAPEAAAKSAAPATTVSVSAMQRAQLREAIVDLAADMTFGVLINHRQSGGNHENSSSNNDGGGGTTTKGTTSVKATSTAVIDSFVPSASRLQALLDNTQTVKRLLSEYETATLGSAAQDAVSLSLVPVPTGGSAVAATNGAGVGQQGSAATAPLTAVRAWNSQKKFAELCALSLKPPSSSASTSNKPPESKVEGAAASPSYQGAFLSFGEKVNPAAAVATTTANEEQQLQQQKQQLREAALKPLSNLQAAVKELEKCKGFNYQEQLQQQSQHSTTAPPLQHMPLLVERMSYVLTELRRHWLQQPKAATRPSTGNTSAGSSRGNSSSAAAAAMPSLVPAEYSKKLFATLATWPQPLLRLLNETLQAAPLEAVAETMRERLRRAKFDVEELAHEQEQAVTDGDMHKSEDLYFQQTELLESMNPLFDQLEHVMETFQHDQVEKPREQLRVLQRQFTSTFQEALRREEKEQRKAAEDLEKLAAQREKLQQIRQQQLAGVTLYTQEWQRLFGDNVKQQEECLRAMEQLEIRMKELAHEQQFLIDDRLARLEEERQRREAAAAFNYFANAHGAALVNTAQELYTLVDSLKQFGAAIEFSCGHFDAYLRDVLLEHVKSELLETRKQRLEQFRSLYLTLGDLQFKKARHADEIAKKVEYYNIQQEIAMDALNPKAKEFSQARQKWEAVQKEVNAQLHTIEVRTQQQLEDFRPTERLLLEAGVKFVHPAEELQRRNDARQQKLLEYKQLMDSRVSGGTDAHESGGGGGGDSSPLLLGNGSDGAADMSGRTAADILAEDMRMFARHAPRLHSTEEGGAVGTSASRTTSAAGTGGGGTSRKGAAGSAAPRVGASSAKARRGK